MIKQTDSDNRIGKELNFSCIISFPSFQSNNCGLRMLNVPKILSLSFLDPDKLETLHSLTKHKRRLISWVKKTSIRLLFLFSVRIEYIHCSFLTEPSLLGRCKFQRLKLLQLFITINLTYS